MRLSKINNLRAQLGRELKMAKKTKIGQSRDEVCRSNCPHWDRMQFLVRQLKQGSTTDTIALQDKDFDKNIQSREINNDNEEEVPKVSLKKWKKERSNYSKTLPMHLQHQKQHLFCYVC